MALDQILTIAGERLPLEAVRGERDYTIREFKDYRGQVDPSSLSLDMPVYDSLEQKIQAKIDNADKEVNKWFQIAHRQKDAAAYLESKLKTIAYRTKESAPIAQAYQRSLEQRWEQWQEHFVDKKSWFGKRKKVKQIKKVLGKYEKKWQTYTSKLDDIAKRVHARELNKKVERDTSYRVLSARKSVARDEDQKREKFMFKQRRKRQKAPNPMQSLTQVNAPQKRIKPWEKVLAASLAIGTAAAIAVGFYYKDLEIPKPATEQAQEYVLPGEPEMQPAPTIKEMVRTAHNEAILAQTSYDESPMWVQPRAKCSDISDKLLSHEMRAMLKKRTHVQPQETFVTQTSFGTNLGTITCFERVQFQEDGSIDIDHFS